MDDKCRKHIHKNLDKLISATDYESLKYKCIQTGMLTQPMINNIERVPYNGYSMTDDELAHERHQRLFYKITQRGPTAYQQLKTVLSELRCDRAVILLNEVFVDESRIKSINQRGHLHHTHHIPSTEDVGDAPQSMNHVHKPIDDNDDDNTDEIKLKLPKFLDTLEPYTGPIEPKIVHDIIKSTKIQVDVKIAIYPMDSLHHRGVFVMVNIIDFPNINQRRSGAEEDGKSLLHLFKNLGFTLFAFQNLTKDEFFRMLDKVTESEYTRKTQCFVMALMTHGNVDANSMQCVEFNDGKIVKVSDIESYFENMRSPNLVNKPKILLFPFCRGDLPDYGIRVQTDGLLSRPSPPFATHSTSDVLICYASVKGFEAHRDTTEGSWYIQKFCELMAMHAHDTSFEDILKLVQSETGKLRTNNGAMQMGTFENRGFNKKLFFNPGIWIDENQ